MIMPLDEGTREEILASNLDPAAKEHLLARLDHVEVVIGLRDRRARRRAVLVRLAAALMSFVLGLAAILVLGGALDLSLTFLHLPGWGRGVLFGASAVLLSSTIVPTLYQSFVRSWGGSR